jgi:hypothetical protein
MRSGLLLVFGVLLMGCGDDGAGGAGGDGGSGGSGGAVTGGAGGALGVACGDVLTCEATQACIEQTNEPTCTDKAAPDDPCPEGQTDTFCGGAGFPCCCDPPPPPDYSCVAVDACGGSVSCACLVDPCEVDLECLDTATPGTVLCQMPQAP